MDSTLKTALPKINILGPDDAGYDEERMRCWNKDVIHRPAAIVQPTTTEEVSQAVKVASSKKLDLVIACGRHGHDCMKEGAMVLDLGKMTEVTVDKKSMTVTVGGVQLPHRSICPSPAAHAADAARTLVRAYADDAARTHLERPPVRIPSACCGQAEPASVTWTRCASSTAWRA